MRVPDYYLPVSLKSLDIFQNRGGIVKLTMYVITTLYIIENNGGFVRNLINGKIR